MRTKWRSLWRFAQIASMVIGITGITLDRLFGAQALLYVGAATLVIIVGFSLLWLPERADKATKKSEVNSLWRRMFQSVTTGVKVFAGDLSWISQHEHSLRHITKSGNSLQILCKHIPTPEARQNIDLALSIGADIYYYPEGRDPRVRGVIINSDDTPNAYMLIVEKRVRVTGSRNYDTVGLPGTEANYQYFAKVYSKRLDPLIFDTMDTLFDTYFKMQNGQRTA